MRTTPTIGADVARQAFDAAVALARATDGKALEAAMRPVLQSLGFETFILTETVSGVTRVTDGTPPALWWPHMTENAYARDDVVFRRARTSPDAFFYSDVTEARDLTSVQKRIVGERKVFGIADGFVNPTHGRGGVLSAVVFTGREIDPRAPDVRAAALVVSDAYGVAIRRLAGVAATPAINLTIRQRDCLSWVREGKSATDIGAILGISVHTVHEHVAEACRRLGVRTRIQAVAAAMALKLIDG